MRYCWAKGKVSRCQEKSGEGPRVCACNPVNRLAIHGNCAPMLSLRSCDLQLLYSTPRFLIDVHRPL